MARGKLSITEAVKRATPRPRSFEQDVSSAENLHRVQQPMPPRLWAAWVGNITGVQVNHACTNADGVCVGFAVGSHGTDMEGKPEYRSPSEICNHLHRLIGTQAEIWSMTEIESAITWLPTTNDRNFCREVIGTLHDPEGEWRASVIAEARRKIAVSLRKMEMNSLIEHRNTPEAKREIEHIRASPVLTEPQEVFQSHLQKLRGSQQQESFGVDDFFAEPAGVK